MTERPTEWWLPSHGLRFAKSPNSPPSVLPWCQRAGLPKLLCHQHKDWGVLLDYRFCLRSSPREKVGSRRENRADPVQTKVCLVEYRGGKSCGIQSFGHREQEPKDRHSSSQSYEDSTRRAVLGQQ